MPWAPGQSGNPTGGRKDRPFRDALRIEAKAAENGEACEAPKGSLRWNARQLLDRGDPMAIRELADRLDGKVPQALVGDDEHPAMQTHQIIELHVIEPGTAEDSNCEVLPPVGQTS